MMRPPTRRRGGALLELAFFFPVLLYLLVGVGDFARYFLQASRLGEIANAAAREAARGETLSDLSVRIETFCSCPSDPEERFACGAGSCGNYGEPAQYVQAFAEKPFSFVARYPGFPATFTLRRSAGVRTR